VSLTLDLPILHIPLEENQAHRVPWDHVGPALSPETKCKQALNLLPPPSSLPRTPILAVCPLANSTPTPNATAKCKCIISSKRKYKRPPNPLLRYVRHTRSSLRHPPARTILPQVHHQYSYAARPNLSPIPRPVLHQICSAHCRHLHVNVDPQSSPSPPMQEE
jgi:hypothetical protein